MDAVAGAADESKGPVSSADQVALAALQALYSPRTLERKLSGGSDMPSLSIGVNDERSKQLRKKKRKPHSTSYDYTVKSPNIKRSPSPNVVRSPSSSSHDAATSASSSDTVNRALVFPPLPAAHRRTSQATSQSSDITRESTDESNLHSSAATTTAPDEASVNSTAEEDAQSGDHSLSPTTAAAASSTPQNDSMRLLSEQQHDTPHTSVHTILATLHSHKAATTSTRQRRKSAAANNNNNNNKSVRRSSRPRKPKVRHDANTSGTRTRSPSPSASPLGIAALATGHRGRVRSSSYSASVPRRHRSRSRSPPAWSSGKGGVTDAVGVLSELASAASSSSRRRRHTLGNEDDFDKEDDGDLEHTGGLLSTPPSRACTKPLAGTGSSCHQCKSRRLLSDLVFCCNILSKKPGKGKRRACRKKYCWQCLVKFYTEKPPSGDEIQSWCCPACRGKCCCALCRRLRLQHIHRSSAVSSSTLTPEARIAAIRSYLSLDAAHDHRTLCEPSTAMAVALVYFRKVDELTSAASADKQKTGTDTAATASPASSPALSSAAASPDMPVVPWPSPASSAKPSPSLPPAMANASTFSPGSKIRVGFSPVFTASISGGVSSSTLSGTGATSTRSASPVASPTASPASPPSAASPAASPSTSSPPAVSTPKFTPAMSPSGSPAVDVNTSLLTLLHIASPNLAAQIRSSGARSRSMAVNALPPVSPLVLPHSSKQVMETLQQTQAPPSKAATPQAKAVDASAVVEESTET